MANFTGEENYTSKVNQTLRAPQAGIVEFFSALAALNIFLSITAAVGNALIIISLKNVSSIHPPTKLFFRCLAATDFCVGLIVQPIYAAFLMPQEMNITVDYYLWVFYSVSSFTLCGVSVLTSTAISVDRLLALLLGLRYRHVVTLRRVRVVITCFWLIGASAGSLWVWRLWRQDIAFKVTSPVLILCLVTSIFCYTRIHLKLRHQQVQVQNNVTHGQQNGEGIPLNIAKYKKTVSSIMWVQFALVVCYAPWGIAAVVGGIYNYVTWHTTSTLVYLNSSLNPILYCWKIKEVKQAVKGTIRQLYCF